MARKIINSIILTLIVVLLFTTIWVNRNFYFENFNQVLYTILFSMDKASKSLIYDYIKGLVCSLVVSKIIIWILLKIRYILTKNDNVMVLKIFNKSFSFDIFNNKLSKILMTLIPTFVLISSLGYSANKFYVFDYIKSQLTHSEFFEHEYIDPRKVSVKFPVKKKNLIYIYLESMESTFTDVEHGGQYDKNYIPELINIANDNINFSANEYVGGAYSVTGTSWTMGAMIGHSAGVPYKVLFNTNNLEEFNSEHDNYKNFLPGAYSIGEILEDNGYKNYLMVGSDSSFGGRKRFFEEHGNYKIYDYYTAIEDEIIEETYYKNWGIEDDVLYEYAKQELKKISKEGKPFNFTMLTVDTHTPDGYVSEDCEIKDENPYMNAVSCSSDKINEFLKWIKRQSFYKDTVVVIVGDHLSMNTYSFGGIDINSRFIYNAYINTGIDTDCSKNRVFNSFDFYPTTLSSLGASIEGDRLGLGTNLFSCKPTLYESYGKDYVKQELNNNSSYYVSCINTNNCHK